MTARVCLAVSLSEEYRPAVLSGPTTHRAAAPRISSPPLPRNRRARSIAGTSPATAAHWSALSAWPAAASAATSSATPSTAPCRTCTVAGTFVCRQSLATWTLVMGRCLEPVAVKPHTGQRRLRGQC